MTQERIKEGVGEGGGRLKQLLSRMTVLPKGHALIDEKRVTGCFTGEIYDLMC